MTRPRRAAFTLMELILVMIIMTLVLALAAPSLSGWRRGARLRDAVQEFIAQTQFARTQSISEAAVFRLTIDTQTAAYQLTMENATGQFEAVESDLSSQVTLPEGYRIELRKPQAGMEDASIRFYPNGRIEPAVVVITADDGDTAQIQCLYPTDTFKVITPGN